MIEVKKKQKMKSKVSAVPKQKPLFQFSKPQNNKTHKEWIGSPPVRRMVSSN